MLPNQKSGDVIEAKLFALRTAVLFLASAVADRFPKGELQTRLEFYAEQTEMRGAEPKFLETADLLRSIAGHLAEQERWGSDSQGSGIGFLSSVKKKA